MGKSEGAHFDANAGSMLQWRTMEAERGIPRSVWLVVAAASAVAVGATLFGAALLGAAVPLASAGVGIVDVYPADGDGAVPVTAPLSVVFSEPMDLASLDEHLRIEPPVDGRLVAEGKEVSFQPRGGLAQSTAYTVTLEAGARSETGREVQSEEVWRFRTRSPQLIFLGRPGPGSEVRQLYLAPSNGQTPRQLTSWPDGVWGYDVHPQGEAIVYSVLSEEGGADLWRMDREGSGQELLLACPEAACLNPAWSPDDRQVAYERRGIWAGAPNLDPKAGRIWLLDLETGEDRTLFDYDVALHSPVWSPKGERLAYASPTIPGVEVYDLQTGELKQFGNEWGAAPVWSPGGESLVVPELMMAGEAFVVRLMRIDLSSEELLDISGDEDFVQDVAPAWSPGGGWIAFGRQFLENERWTPGRQIWLTRPDASEAYGLTAEGMMDSFGFAWRPDGGALAHARTELSGGPQAVPDVSVWVFDFKDGEARRVARDAVLPKWLP